MNGIGVSCGASAKLQSRTLRDDQLGGDEPFASEHSAPPGCSPHGLAGMKNRSEQDVSAHLTGLSAFFGGLAFETNLAVGSHKTDLLAFFTGLAPAVRIARRAQAELDRRAATRFSLFDFFHEREEDLSRVFAGLLDPGGTHGQGDAFLRLFLNEVRKVLENEMRERFPAGNLRYSRVYLEHRTETGRSIDIVVRVRGDTWIGIENKPWAGEQPNQVSDYMKYLRTRAGPDTDPDAWVVYLSGDGKPPETLPDDPEDRMRCPTLPYRGAERGSPSLSNWVEKCRIECEAERVRWFLTDLLEYIRRWFEPAEPAGTGDRS